MNAFHTYFTTFKYTFEQYNEAKQSTKYTTLNLYVLIAFIGLELLY